VLTDDGRLDFHAAVARSVAARAIASRAESTPATVMVFDVLFHNSADLRPLPYAQRHAILETLPLPDEWVVPPVSDDAAAMVAASAAQGLEGVVAKRLDSRYTSGRSRAWIKHRHQDLIDAVVVGWAERDTDTISLLLAEATEDGLVYAGRCPAPKHLAPDVLAPLRAPGRPPGMPLRRNVHWVRPVLLVEVQAASRTPEGRMRQPRLVRVRLDDLT
jgi:bifunctional non-homologous end joining protein LigD